MIRLLLCGFFIVLAPVQAFSQAARVLLTDQQKQVVSAYSKMKRYKFPDIPFPENWLGKDEKDRGAPVISFAIAPDGTTHDVKLKRSSGVRKIDNGQWTSFALGNISRRRHAQGLIPLQR